MDTTLVAMVAASSLSPVQTRCEKSTGFSTRSFQFTDNLQACCVWTAFQTGAQRLQPNGYRQSGKMKIIASQIDIHRLCTHAHCIHETLQLILNMIAACSVAVQRANKLQRHTQTALRSVHTHAQTDCTFFRFIRTISPQTWVRAISLVMPRTECSECTNLYTLPGYWYILNTRSFEAIHYCILLCFMQTSMRITYSRGLDSH